MQLRQRLEYKKIDETNISFGSHSFWLGLHVLVRQEEEEEEEDGEGEEEEQKGMFLYWNYVAFGCLGFLACSMEISCSLF